MRTLLVGTRASVLARTQAGTVSDALTGGGNPAELHFVHTPGDASQKAQTPVNRIGVGVFTETLRNAPRRRRVRCRGALLQGPAHRPRSPFHPGRAAARGRP
jgi:porphobilinogen deaminase